MCVLVHISMVLYCSYAPWVSPRTVRDLAIHNFTSGLEAGCALWTTICGSACRHLWQINTMGQAGAIITNRFVSNNVCITVDQAKAAA